MGEQERIDGGGKKKSSDLGLTTHVQNVHLN